MNAQPEALHLYFFRHAEAEDAVGSMADFDRALTPRGIERTRAAAKMLKALGVMPEALYSSPLVRARQTADILSEALNVPVEARDALRPGFNAQAAEALVSAHGRGDLMLVGHEPDFSETISRLIGGGAITMKKGGLARIDVETRQPLLGSLIWLIAPKVFDAGYR